MTNLIFRIKKNGIVYLYRSFVLDVLQEKDLIRNMKQQKAFSSGHEKDIKDKGKITTELNMESIRKDEYIR